MLEELKEEKKVNDHNQVKLRWNLENATLLTSCTVHRNTYAQHFWMCVSIDTVTLMNPYQACVQQHPRPRLVWNFPGGGWLHSPGVGVGSRRLAGGAVLSLGGMTWSSHTRGWGGHGYQVRALFTTSLGTSELLHPQSSVYLFKASELHSHCEPIVSSTRVYVASVPLAFVACSWSMFLRFSVSGLEVY